MRNTTLAKADLKLILDQRARHRGHARGNNASWHERWCYVWGNLGPNATRAEEKANLLPYLRHLNLQVAQALLNDGELEKIYSDLSNPYTPIPKPTQYCFPLNAGAAANTQQVFKPTINLHGHIGAVSALYCLAN